MLSVITQNIGFWASLVQAGIASIERIVTAVRAGKAVVEREPGVVVEPEDVAASIQAALDASASTGDAAAARIEERHD